MLYPWHQPAWQQLSTEGHCLPHALLLYGQRHTGKAAFARHLAQTLLCETPGNSPCTHCPSCHLFQQNSHPDCYLLNPAAEENDTRKLLQIKIHDVREVIDAVRLTAVRGNKRIVLIEPAESLNHQAANALLKILEEPPENVYFILISHARDKLLPTIKSRCRQIILPPPDPSEAAAYLAENGLPDADALLAFHSGAPLFTPNPDQDSMRERLCSLLSTPRLLAILDFAAEFDKQKWPLALFLDWLQKWLIDIGLAQQQLPARYYPHHQAALNHLGNHSHTITLFELNHKIQLLHPYGHHTLNTKLQLESLLSQYLNFSQNKPPSCNSSTHTAT